MLASGASSYLGAWPKVERMIRGQRKRAAFNLSSIYDWEFLQWVEVPGKVDGIKDKGLTLPNQRFGITLSSIGIKQK